MMDTVDYRQQMHNHHLDSLGYHHTGGGGGGHHGRMMSPSPSSASTNGGGGCYGGGGGGGGVLNGSSYTTLQPLPPIGSVSDKFGGGGGQMICSGGGGPFGFSSSPMEMDYGGSVYKYSDKFNSMGIVGSPSSSSSVNGGGFGGLGVSPSCSLTMIGGGHHGGGGGGHCGGGHGGYGGLQHSSFYPSTPGYSQNGLLQAAAAAAASVHTKTDPSKLMSSIHHQQSSPTYGGAGDPYSSRSLLHCGPPPMSAAASLSAVGRGLLPSSSSSPGPFNGHMFSMGHPSTSPGRGGGLGGAPAHHHHSSLLGGSLLRDHSSALSSVDLRAAAAAAAAAGGLASKSHHHHHHHHEMEEINTKDLAQKISSELKRYSIPQAVFAQRVLCRSQGTLSDLLRNPKPWSKLKSGRETFRRMWKWLQEPEFQRMSALRLAGKLTGIRRSFFCILIFISPARTARAAPIINTMIQQADKTKEKAQNIHT